MQDLSCCFYGCKVIQKVIEVAPLQIINQNIIVAVIENFMYFSMKNYSNYIVQNTFNKSDDEQQVRMTKIAVCNFMELSSNKFGSNIIEVMLKSQNPAVKQMIIDTIFLGEGNEDCYINRLMKDQFGN